MSDNALPREVRVLSAGGGIRQATMSGGRQMPRHARHRLLHSHGNQVYLAGAY